MNMKRINKIILLSILLTFGCSFNISTSTNSSSFELSNNTNLLNSSTNKISSTSSSTNNSNSESSSDSESSSKNDYGELIIDKLQIYTDFPDTPTVHFTNPKYISEISYEVKYSSVISYENGYFNAIGEGSALVEATTKYHSTTFVVEAKKYDCGRGENQTNSFLNRIKAVEKHWNNEKIKNGTLFIGDSFFDEVQFFTNFYDLYRNQNAYCHGISSSRIEDWYIFSKRLVYPVQPKNIVLHIGTNDMFSGKEDPFDMLDELKVLFEEYENRLPGVNIYWFAIEPRTYGIGGGSFNRKTYDTICLMNKLVEKYCSENDNLHFVDVSDNCYLTGINVNSEFFSDGVHPKVENYSLYCKALLDAGLDLPYIEEEQTTSTLTYDIDSTVAGSAKHLKLNGKILNNNFSVSGKMELLNCSTNPHIEFSYDSTHFDNRFLLWDDDNNKTFNLGYAFNKTHIKNAKNLNIKLNQEFIFEVVITNKHAYLYIDNNLQIVYRNINATFFTISSANTEAIVNEIKLISKEDSTQWKNISSRNEIKLQEENSITTKEVIVI